MRHGVAVTVLVLCSSLHGGHAERPSESKCFLKGGKGGDPAPFHDDDFGYYSKLNFDDCKNIDGIDRWLDDTGTIVGGLTKCCEAAQEYFRCLNTADYSSWKVLLDDSLPPFMSKFKKFLVMCLIDIRAK